MNFLLNPTAWLIIGALLMISELIVPGGIVFFLGAACAIVSGAIYFGLVTTWVDALTLFFVSSLFLIIALRAVVQVVAESYGVRTIINLKA